MSGLPTRSLSWLVALPCLACLSLTVLPAQRVLWTQPGPVSTPNPRYFHAMAHDAVHQQVLLFGGIRNDGVLMADTWTWNGVTWSQRMPTHAPMARYRHAVARDGSRRRIVLFGGTTANGPMSDTWEWNGTDWLQLSPTNVPAPRFGHAMAWDAGRREVVLFGGTLTASVNFTDTWTWNGTDWQLRAPANHPSARRDHAMAYDGRVVLFGGQNNAGDRLNDTWEWNGTDWTVASGTNAPGIRKDHTMAYDASRGRLVLFGGRDGDTIRSGPREWDGNTWLEAPALPSERYGATMAYDPSRRRIVMFGGRDANTVFGETWEYYLADPATFTPYGSGCAGLGVTPALSASHDNLPWLGEPFATQLDSLPLSPFTFAILLLGFDDTNWNGLPLPLDLGPQGMPGCTLYMAPADTIGLSNRGGWAFHELPIPNDLALLGTRFFMQGWVFTVGVNPLGAIVSNAGAGRIGAR